MDNSSLDRLAHIANMSHELHQRESPVKVEGSASKSADPREHSPTAAQQQKMKKMACTCCRQQKSKCDAHERHPLPCTQCAKKNLACEVDAGFRRKGKRAHLARIEREFLELKRSFQDPHAAEDFHRTAPHLAAYVSAQTRSPSTPPYSSAPPAPYLQPQPLLPPSVARGVPQTQGLNFASRNFTPPPAPQRSPLAPLAAPTIPEHVLACEAKAVESVTLEPHTIRTLYLAYVKHYHPLLPVVDVLKGPERLHRLCPALFWVVMFVALRRHGDRELYFRLSPLVKNILAEISISPITRYNPTEDDEPLLNACSVYSVQAFVLYSLWPPLTSSLSADSSWNTIGVALFQAIRIGLHSASPSQEHTRTWLLCNTVSQHIASAFGFPAFVQIDLQYERSVLPLATRHIVELAHFEHQVASTLTSGRPGPGHVPERIALAKVLLQQLDELGAKMGHGSSGDNGPGGHGNDRESETREHQGENDSIATAFEDHLWRLHHLVARVHLLTCYFLDAQHIPPHELAQGLVRLFHAAVHLVAHVDTCEARDRGFVKYLPVVWILHLWQASCIIVKLAHSPLKTALDVDNAKTTYSAAIRLVARASVLKHDIAYRASGIMRHMWQLFRTLDENNQATIELNTTSRMTASVFFDCLALLRDQVGVAKLSLQTDVRENAPENGDADSSDADPAASSDDDALPGESEKTTPGSVGSGTARKKRRLSGVHDAESKARRIIRTIPLDPRPIAASSRSSVFKVVNASSNSSPSFSVKTDDSRGHVSPQGGLEPSGYLGNLRTAANSANLDLVHLDSVSPPSNLPGDLGMTTGLADNMGPPSENAHSDMSATLESNMLDMNNDLLWKDVDSLMNDFGFHT